MLKLVVPDTSPPDLMPLTLEEFFKVHERRAYKVALMATRRQADALDVVQDAMVQMVVYYTNHNPAEWRFIFQKVLNSKIMDWHRQTTKRNKWFVWGSASEEDDNGEEGVIANYSDEVGDPARLLAAAKSLEHVVVAVEALPLRQRQAFMLRVWEGFDVRETSAIMECSEGSVKTHLSRAIDALKQSLHDWR